MNLDSQLADISESVSSSEYLCMGFKILQVAPDVLRDLTLSRAACMSLRSHSTVLTR